MAIIATPNTSDLSSPADLTNPTVPAVPAKQRRQRINEALHATENGNDPTYRDLFAEKWAERAAPGSLEAWDSPVAYLVHLYALALQIEGENKDNTHRLELRRPDLATLLVDDVAVEKEMPTLELVNDILSQSIREQGGGTNLDHTLSTTWYPFNLPFHLPLNQITLGLRAANTSLGTVIRQTNQQAPGFIGDAIGGTQARAALKAYAELSPEQQKILTEKSDLTNYLQSNYGPLFKVKEGTVEVVELITVAELVTAKVAEFCQATGLHRTELDQLLASGAYAPTISQKIKQSVVSAHKYGAIYLNQGESKAALTINDEGMLAGTKAAFARLNHLIRLQRWLALPFDQLDWLIAALARAAGEPKAEAFNDGMLRGLGLFRHLQREYGLESDVFAAFIHEISPYARDSATPLLDRVFCVTGAAGTSIAIDDGVFDRETVQYLCTGLGISEAVFAQLAALVELTELTDGKFKRSLPVISMFYRLVKIPRLLGLTVEEGLMLLRLMGGTDIYIEALLSPSIIKESEGKTDILDVILALESAVHWLKTHKLSVAQVSTWCTKSIPRLINNKEALLKRLNTIKQAIQPWLLNKASFACAELIASVDENKLPIEWLTMLKDFVSGNGVVTGLSLLEHLMEWKEKEKIFHKKNEELIALNNEFFDLIKKEIDSIKKEDKDIEEEFDHNKENLYIGSDLREDLLKSLKEVLDVAIHKKNRNSKIEEDIQKKIDKLKFSMRPLSELEDDLNKKKIDLHERQLKLEKASIESKITPQLIRHNKKEFESLREKIGPLKKEVKNLSELQEELLKKLTQKGAASNVKFFESLHPLVRKKLIEILSQAQSAQLNATASAMSQIYTLPLETLRAILNWPYFDWQAFVSKTLDLNKDNPENVQGAYLQRVYALDRHVDVVKTLKLSAPALEVLLAKPEWADHVELTFQDIYRLSRYADFLSSNVKDEAQALDCLERFNAQGQIHTDGTYALLADVFSWEKSEVKAAVAQFKEPLEEKTAAAPSTEKPEAQAAAYSKQQGESSLDHIDWLMRLHTLSRQTGLSVASLLDAAKLHQATAFSAWQTVGQAVISAAARGVLTQAA